MCTVLLFQMVIAFKSPKTFILSTSFKKLGGAVANGRRPSIARTAPLDDRLLHQILGRLVVYFRREFCEERFFRIRHTDLETLLIFLWKKLVQELEVHALKLLQGCIPYKSSVSHDSLFGMCASIELVA